MAKSNPHAAGMLRLLYQNVALAGVADALTVPGDVTWNLHTADPGVGGDPTTNVATYPGYAPVTQTRSPANFPVTEGVGGQAGRVQNGAEVLFPTPTSGSQVITHWSLSINGVVRHTGALTSDGQPLAGDSSNAQPVTLTPANSPIRFEANAWGVNEN